MRRAGWRFANGSAAPEDSFHGRPSRSQRLGFRGLGTVRVLVRSAREARELVGSEVLVKFSGLVVARLGPLEECDLLLSYQPGDELEIVEWGARASLSDVDVLSHQCSASSVSGTDDAPLCGTLQPVRLGWAACAARPRKDPSAVRWVEATVERVLNSTHARVRLAAAGDDRPSEPRGTFDPASPLVSYQDMGSCGPRGDDASVDPRACPLGTEVVEVVPNRNFQVVAEVKGCSYFAYTVHRCRRGRGATRARLVTAQQLWPRSVRLPGQAAGAWSPGPVHCGGFAPARRRIAVVLVGDPHFQQRYEAQIQSHRCFTQHHGYEMKILRGDEYGRCAQYGNFFFRKHCTVAEFLETQPPEYVAAVVDMDVVAMPLERGLETWAYHDADVQLYMRCLLPEIMAGNYMVRNTPFARRFLYDWAKYNHQMPPGFSSSDNGALHLAVMEVLEVEGFKRCKKRYQRLDKPVTDTSQYWAFVQCTLDALGPARSWRARGGGELTIWPRLQFYAADGVYLGRAASDDAGPVMHHGIKDPQDVRKHYFADLYRCRLNSSGVLRSGYEMGRQALHLGLSYKDMFPQGRGCEQCAERCLPTFSCPPLKNGATPRPRQPCADCG